jgi:hypothetical protein
VSLHLITRGDDKPVEFQFWDSSGIGKIDGKAVFDGLIQIAALVAVGENLPAPGNIYIGASAQPSSSTLASWMSAVSSPCVNHL